MSNFYIYKHTKPTGEIFYIGMGRGNRHSVITGRSKFWTNIYNKYGRVSEIILNNLNKEQAYLYESTFIKIYGRLDNKTGVLCNLSAGGEDIWNRGTKGLGRYGMMNTQNQKDIVSRNMKDNNPMKRDECRLKSSVSHLGKKWDTNHNRLRSILVTKDGEYVGTFNGPKDTSDSLNLKYYSVINAIRRNQSLFGYKIIYQNV